MVLDYFRHIADNGDPLGDMTFRKLVCASGPFVLKFTDIGKKHFVAFM